MARFDELYQMPMVVLHNGDTITLQELAALIFEIVGGGSPLLQVKGDMIVALSNMLAARLPVGVNGQSLIADSSEATGVKWTVPALGGGNVLGPASAVDERIALFNGTSGKAIKDGLKTIADIFADHVALADPHNQYALDTDLNNYQPLDALLTSLALLAFSGNSLKVLRVNAGETDFEWVALAGGGDLLSTNNLSDLANAATSRNNLGLAALAILAAVTEAEITLADNTTNDVSITKHGLAPKAPNVATQYLNGIGAYSTPPDTDNDTLVNETITLSGDATGSGTNAITVVIGANVISTAKILDAAVTLAKLANIATARFLGRVTASTGVVEELTAAQAKTILALVKGDVGLGNVDDTSDNAKPVSTAQQTALDGKVDDAEISNMDNTADNVKIVAGAVEWDGAAKTVSTIAPLDANGNDGDIHFKYTA